MISIKYVSTSARSLGNARGTGPRGLHRDSVSVPGLLASVYERCSQVQDAGGVRVGQTRSDLDCRVVATSRRVAPTECDSRLPPFWLRLDVSPPTPRLLAATRGGSVVFDSSRGSTRVSRPVAQTESDSSDIRGGCMGGGGWPDSSDSSDSSDSVGLCRTKMSRAARLVRLAVGRKCLRLNFDSSTRRLLGLCRTKMSRAARLVRLAVGRKVPSTPRLVDFSFYFLFLGLQVTVYARRIRLTSSTSPTRLLSNVSRVVALERRPSCKVPPPPPPPPPPPHPPPPPPPSHPPTQSATRLPSAHLTTRATRPLGLAAQEAWMQPEH